MQRFSTALAAIAILAVLFLLVRLGKLEDELKAVKAHAVSPAPASARQGEEDDDEHEEAGEHGDVEVAHYMGRIQHYTQKLYWAGKAGNLTLAEFYR
ncbi:MAG TPA: hypothetical protein VHL57_11215, partial [Flavobacteriales bacterium]|nr:hypothetical protein [Flavobacteriales bacterium]